MNADTHHFCDIKLFQPFIILKGKDLPTSWNKKLRYETIAINGNPIPDPIFQHIFTNPGPNFQSELIY